MENFKHRKKEIEFWQLTGEVLGSDKYSETHVSVSSSGGGGYVGPNGGHVSAPKVHSSSSSITNHEFWIKTADGLEKDIKLKGADIPLRAGQKITLISAGRKGKDTGWYSVLVNHSAGKHWFINKADDLNNRLRIELMTGKSLIIAAIILFGTAYLTAPESYGYFLDRNFGRAEWGVAWGLAIGFGVLRFLIKTVRISSLYKRLNSHLENLAQQAYQKTS